MSSCEAGRAMYNCIIDILKKYPDYRPPTTEQQQQQHKQQLQQQLQKQTLNHMMSADVASLCTSYLDELNEMMKQVIKQMTSKGYDVSEQSCELLKQHLMWEKPEKKSKVEDEDEDDDDSYDGESYGGDKMHWINLKVKCLHYIPMDIPKNKLVKWQQIADRCEELGHGEAGDTAVRESLWESLAYDAVAERRSQ